MPVKVCCEWIVSRSRKDSVEVGVVGVVGVVVVWKFQRLKAA